MTRSIRIARLASEELAEAIRWYENRRRGLGRDLYDAVVASMDSIVSHPEIGSLLLDERNTRRLVVARFPYQIVYRLTAADVVIVAIAHAKRRPGFWRHRR